jgi:hypothetical protein
MAQPYNYSLNVPSPMQAFGQAFNVGAAGQKAKEDRQARELALKRQEEGNTLVNEYFETPADQRTYDQALRIGMYNPQFAELAQKQFDALSEQQQQSAFTDATQIHSALLNVLAGETDFEILDQILDRRVQATKGNPGLNKMWSDARELARTDPDAAELMVASRIATLPGGKDYFATMKARGEEARAAQLQPGAIKKQTQELQRSSIDTNKILAEMGGDMSLLTTEDVVSLGPAAVDSLSRLSKLTKRQQAATAAKDDRAITKLDNEIRAQQDDFRRKAQEEVTKVAEEVTSINNLLTSVNEALSLGSVKPTVGWGGTAIQAATGGIQGREYFPSFRDDVLNFERQLETIDAQGFLAQVPKMAGTGTLTETEGKMLTRALGNLSLVQGSENLIKNLKQIQKIMIVASERSEKRFGSFLERQKEADLEPMNLPNLIFVEQANEWMERPRNTTDEVWSKFIEFQKVPASNDEYNPMDVR